MGKIGVLCPSRMRPKGLERAFNSWKLNSVSSDIIFGFQDSDPSLNDNIDIVKPCPFLILGDIGLAAKVNYLCSALTGYDAYMVFNDDLIVHTPGWDKLLLDKLDDLESKSKHRLWILHWRDGIQDGNLCQGFSTKELLSITNSFFPIGYMRHLFVDNYYKFIGESCGILHYVPEVFIEHLHYTAGKSQLDDNYRQTNSIEAYNRDGEAFRKWVEQNGEDLVSKIMNKISEYKSL